MRDLHLASSSRKLGPRFIGLFEVEAIVKLVDVKLRLPPTLKVAAQARGVQFPVCQYMLQTIGELLGVHPRLHNWNCRKWEWCGVLCGD